MTPTDHSPPTDRDPDCLPRVIVNPDFGDDLDDAAHALRRREPSRHISAVARMENEAERMAEIRQELFAGIEKLTGKRLGEVEALRAVADGAEHHRAVARRTGQSDAAADATVAGLVRDGYLSRHRHPAERRRDAEPTLVSVTARGRALLAQVDAIRLRLLDAVVDSIDDGQLDLARQAAEILASGSHGSWPAMDDHVVR